MRIKPIEITYNGQTVLSVKPAGAKRRNEERDAELCELYEALKKENPTAAPFTLCRAIEAMRPIKSQAMYFILQRNGRI